MPDMRREYVCFKGGMMAKMITLIRCADCPYRVTQASDVRLYDLCYKNPGGLKEIRPDIRFLPSWCPLPEAKEDKDGGK
jgi:hypothetical protein